MDQFSFLNIFRLPLDKKKYRNCAENVFVEREGQY